MLNEDEIKKQDKKLYILKNNKEFLKKFKELLNNGYIPVLSTYDMQQLIDDITNWYKIKYPNNEISRGYRIDEDLIVEPIAKYMDTKQLLSRLGSNANIFLHNYYRSSNGFSGTTKDMNGEEVNNDYILPIYLGVDFSGLHRIAYISSKTGLINDVTELSTDLYHKSITDLLKLDEGEYNLDSLKKCIWQHKSTDNLRREILELTALKILYSETNPVIGFERANLFLREMKEDLNIPVNQLNANILYPNNSRKLTK